VLERDMVSNTTPYRMNQRGRPHAAQHLGKCAVQTAQAALKGSLALAVVLGRQLSGGMRREVRQRNLLREEQQENTGQMQIDAFHVPGKPA
jgi:hypothetical protein